MVATDRLSARETRRLQTRERLLGAAIAEFKRSGMAEADVGAIVAAAGVAHGTFFFHFPTKEHVLLELEHREEERIAAQFRKFVGSKRPFVGAPRGGPPDLGLGAPTGRLFCLKTLSPCIFLNSTTRGGG